MWQSIRVFFPVLFLAGLLFPASSSARPGALSPLGRADFSALERNDVLCELDGRGCTNAPRRTDHLRCVMEHVREDAAQGTLSLALGRAVRRCAGDSTCARPGRIACRYLGPDKTLWCRIATPAACEARGGVITGCSTCCEACDGLCPYPRANCAEIYSCERCTATSGCQYCNEQRCISTYLSCDDGVVPDCE